jgi:hypothetical protein
VLLKKSLYGDRVDNLAWDETQSQWLTSSEIGFKRLPSDGSIYVKRLELGTIIVLNRFDVKLLGQATWYLQSRITPLCVVDNGLDSNERDLLLVLHGLEPQ